MKTTKRAFLFGAAALVLAGCAGVSPTASVIDAPIRDTLRVTDASVDVSAMGPTTAGRQIATPSVKAALERDLNATLVGQGQGTRNVRAVVAMQSVNIITAGQSILIGGESVMKGTLSLVDARTGAVILEPTEITSGGGGWAAGGLVAVATREDSATELNQMSLEFARRARVLVFGN
ncbi:hypothetical protein [Thalassococcus sp. S3]|uniref:hypothetical protein n=1 Tax=Thalassococcus sp. S3 TaxID=2017482 RepID=UPI001024218B|nr:hypothetical protein [Thalassococcus sp. S3]QBF30102.1 hypothetical protein CFI11_02565 [Thalassococcus sp. S3]